MHSSARRARAGASASRKHWLPVGRLAAAPVGHGSQVSGFARPTPYDVAVHVYAGGNAVKTSSRVLLGAAAAVVVAAGAGYLFREPLMTAASEALTRDMFLAADGDAFDPGVGVGEIFPEIQARYQGSTVRDVGRFAGPNGLIFLAARSADW